MRVCRRDILRLHGCCRHGHSVSTFRLAAVMVLQAELCRKYASYEGACLKIIVVAPLKRAPLDKFHL